VRAARGLDEPGLLEQRDDALEVGERQALGSAIALSETGRSALARPSSTSSRTPYSAFVVKITPKSYRAGRRTRSTRARRRPPRVG
jgi:hypothetical protein